MDIEILLWFQNFRELTSDWLSSFFNFFTTVAVDHFILASMLVIFWTVDKKRGLKILLTWGTSLCVGAFLKTVFCVYRPWIRDARITPPETVKAGATGYSFPSGHCFSAGGFWNGVLLTYRKYKAIVIFSVIMVLLTMISRLYFTVHTPQDVLAGGLISLLLAYLISKLYDWVEMKANRDIYVLVIATVLMIALLCYIGLKSYPMDYVDGVLVVDPKKMTVDGFKDPGRFYGIVLGWFIERRFVKFRIEGTTAQKVIRSLVGGLLVVFWWNVVATPIGNAAGIGIVHFIMQATTPLICMTVYPWIFSRYEERHPVTCQSQAGAVNDR